MTHNTAQPIPDTEGEWRVVPEPAAPVIAEIHCGNTIIAGLMSTETANQIVADHKAVKSQALLVEALRLARKTLMVYAEDDHVDNPEELIAIRYIDAALKAAGVE